MPTKQLTNKKLPNGFTLVELLVVITIIAILMTIGLVAYSSVLDQGRDSKRLSDLRSIQSALEQYFADQFFYPAGNLPFGSPLTNCTGTPSCSVTKTYLNTVPSDPTSSPNYCYKPLKSTQDCTLATQDCSNSGSAADKCIKYCLYAKLENQPTGSSRCGSTTDYNFMLTPP